MPYSVLGDPLEIKLESSDLVLRGYTGDEYEPALLKGELVVNLTEDTNFREILCVLFLSLLRVNEAR